MDIIPRRETVIPGISGLFAKLAPGLQSLALRMIEMRTSTGTNMFTHSISGGLLVADAIHVL